MPGGANRPGAFELDAIQKRHAVLDADPVERAAAFLLEGFLDQRAGAPLGDEALIGVDGERLVGRTGSERRERNSRGERQGESGQCWLETHGRASSCSVLKGNKALGATSNPSAGANRIRFFGLADASQPGCCRAPR